MPHFRQHLGAAISRRHPFLNGVGTIANSTYFRRLMSDVRADGWCPLHGAKLLAPLDAYVSRAALYMGRLDHKLTAIVRLMLRSGNSVFDIGANLGVMTVPLPGMVGPGGRVRALEPHVRVSPPNQANIAVGHHRRRWFPACKVRPDAGPGDCFSTKEQQ